MSMAKPEWGAKRQCVSCGERFYDLNRDPILCPECGAPFEIEALVRGKRARAVARPETAKAVVEDVELVDDEDEDDAVVIPDADEDDDDADVAPAAASVDDDADIETDDDVLLEDDDDDRVADEIDDLVENDGEDDLNR
jgi:uncharacterized protein (TIGR02300 family)